MKMVLVNDAPSKREFLDFPTLINRDNPDYIIPLEKDIEGVFDKDKNKFFKSGVCERWICINEEGQTIGKIAAFINRKYNQDQPTGGIGFFDCINDNTVSTYLFDHCKSWLADQGMEAMDGPINFGERDKFWGLLIEGFTAPLYGMNFNPPYYEALFTAYGFEVYFYQLCFSRNLYDELSDNFKITHDKIAMTPGIRMNRIQKSKLAQQAADFTEIYNKAWASHGQGKQLEVPVAKKMFQSMKPILNEHISFLAYENEKPIGMWVNLPDVNQWFRHLNGKFTLWHKLKFLWLKLTKKNIKFIGLVFGVVPEWQRKGVDAYMIYEGAEHIKKHTDFEYYEMQWIGDFNPKMIRIAETLKTKTSRKLATYRYLFDRTKPFERHPIL